MGFDQLNLKSVGFGVNIVTGSAISLVVSLVSTCSFGTETAPLLFPASTESFVTFSILPSIETTAAVTSFISSEVVLAF